jgi:hypothetical protein
MGPFLFAHDATLKSREEFLDTLTCPLLNHTMPAAVS